jgi:hypothetical protein
VSAFKEINRNPGCNERGGSIHQNNIAWRAILAGENFADGRGVFRGSYAADGFDWRARNSEMLRCHCEAPHNCAFYFGHQRFSGKRNFVQAACPVNYERVLGAKLRERVCDQIDQVRGGNADDLRACSGGICQRTEKIEDGARTNLLPRWRGMASGGVCGAREEKTNANLAESAAVMFDR